MEEKKIPSSEQDRLLEQPNKPWNCLIEFKCSQAHGFCAVNYIHDWGILPDCEGNTLATRIAHIGRRIFNSGQAGYNFTGRIYPFIVILKFSKQPEPRELALQIIKQFHAPNIVRLADVTNQGMHQWISDHLKDGEIIENDRGSWKVIKHEPLRNYNSGNIVQEVDLMQCRSERFGNRK